MNKLPVLVIGNFCIIHIECSYGHRFAFGVHSVGYILIVRPHDEASEMNVVHSIRIVLYKIFPRLNSYQFSSATSTAT